MDPQWQTITTDMPYVSRLPVPGGWIYRVNYTATTCEIVFVPDTAARDAALMAAFGKRSDDTNH